MSVQVEINNSTSRITGLTSQQEKRLRKLLSYQASPQQSYFSGGFNHIKYLIDKKGEFPTGLVGNVFCFLKKIPHKVVDRRKKPQKIDNLFKLNLKD